MEELRVVITADASGVGPGVAEATAAVQSGADAIAVAQQKATAATKQLTEAQIQLGAAAEAGSTAAASIIAEYAQASATATAQLQALTSAQEANTASTVKNTLAQDEDTKVTYNRTEAMGAARIAMGAADGSFGMMAGGLARIAAGSSVVGPLLANLVPLAIFAVGVDLLVQLGEEIYKAFDLGGEAALAYQKALDGIDESTRTLIDSTSLEADKIEAANLKLEHLPNPNAQKEAIDEALVDADKMASKLDGIIDKEEKLLTMQGAAGSGLQRFFTNEQAPRQEGVDLAQHARYLEQATTLEQQLAESKSFVANEQARVNELTSKQVALDALRNTSMEARVGMWAIGVSQYNKEIDSLNQIIAQENKVTQGIQDQIRVRDAQTKHDALVSDPKTKADIGRQTRENYAEEAAALKLQGANLGEILLFWERINKDGEHNTEVLRAQEELLKQIDAHGTIKGGDAGKALVEPAPIRDVGGLGGKEQTPEQNAAEIDGAIDRQISAKQRLYEQDVRNIEAEERLGLITAKEAAAEELKLQRLAQQAEIAPLAARQKEIAPLGPTGLDEQQLKEYQQLEQKMDQLAQAGALKREQIAQQEAQKFEQTYKRVATTFNNDFSRAFDEWATKSKTAGQAFGEMLGQMELQVIGFVAKTILEHAEMWAEIKIMNALGIETTQAQNAAANLKQITQDAKTAAANAYNWASAWGGPIAGAAAAAVAFTAVEAFGVFDTGGMMPHMGFAMNTSGSPERVLSPSQTSNFESLVNNGGSRSATLNQTNNFGGGVTKDMLDAHTSKTMSQLRAMIRPEALA